MPRVTPTTPGDRVPPEDVRLRVATEDDVPALVSLVESAYRGESSLAGWTTEAHLLDGQRTDPEEVTDLIRAPDSRLLAAEHDTGLVACCHLRRETDDAGAPAAYLGMFAVRPTAQGAGIGSLVLAEAERHAAGTWGARLVRMKVIADREDLIVWYERRGYARTGRRSPFPYGDERFGIPRRPGLEFELLVKPLS